MKNTLEEEASYFDDEPEKYSYLRRIVRYHNVNANIEIQKRASKGFELFGKHFLDLWD